MSISHPRLRRTPPQITNPGIHAAAPVAKVITNDFGMKSLEVTQLEERLAGIEQRLADELRLSVRPLR